MSYPIRYRLVNKETGKVFKHTNETNHTFGVIYPDGTPAQICEYTYERTIIKLSCKDYYLEVALEKDAKGNWIYKRIGYQL